MLFPSPLFFKYWKLMNCKVTNDGNLVHFMWKRPLKSELSLVTQYSRSEEQWSPWIWLKSSQHAPFFPLIDPWYACKSLIFLFQKTGVIMPSSLANRFCEVQMKVFKHIKFSAWKDRFLLLNVLCLLCFIILRVQKWLCWYILCDIYYFSEDLHNSFGRTLACNSCTSYSTCTYNFRLHF